MNARSAGANATAAAGDLASAFTYTGPPPPPATGNVPEQLLCGICHDVLTDPRRLLPCNHTFCGECVESWQRHHHNQQQQSRRGADEATAAGASCPLDRTPIQATAAADPIVASLLSVLPVVCNVCGFRGDRGQHLAVDNRHPRCKALPCEHVKDCGFVGYSAEELVAHVRDAHEFECAMCGCWLLGKDDIRLHRDRCFDPIPGVRLGMSPSEVYVTLFPDTEPAIRTDWPALPIASEVRNCECRYFWFPLSKFEGAALHPRLRACLPVDTYICFLFHPTAGLAVISVRSQDPALLRRFGEVTGLRAPSKGRSVVHDHFAGAPRLVWWVYMGWVKLDNGFVIVEFVNPEARLQNGRVYEL